MLQSMRNIFRKSLNRRLRFQIHVHIYIVVNMMASWGEIYFVLSMDVVSLFEEEFRV